MKRSPAPRGTRRPLNWTRQGMLFAVAAVSSALGSSACSSEAPAPTNGWGGAVHGGGAGRASTAGVPGGGTPGAGGSTAGTAASGASHVGGASEAGASTGAGGAGAAAVGGGGSGGGSSAPCPKPAGETCHEFFAADNSRNELRYVNEFEPEKGWLKSVGDTGANSPRAIQLVDSVNAVAGKAVLLSVDKGYVELDMVTGAELARVGGYSAITSASRMPDGTTAIASNDAIHVVNAQGDELRKFALPAGAELRAVNRHPTTGNFWLSKTEKIYELADGGAVRWSADLGAGKKGYAVWWREGGGAYATTGEPATIVELDANGAVLKELGGEAKFPILDFFSGFVRLANGNYVACNWLGHLQAPSELRPQLVELNAQDELVWQWGTQTLARQITNVLVVR